MKTLSKSLLLNLFGMVLCLNAADKPRQAYPLDPIKAKANAAKVASELQKAPQWKSLPLVYYSVPAISDVRRIADTYPEDGEFAGTLGVIAAKGEYEPVSFVIYPLQNIDKLELKVTDLKSATGKTLPASAVDLKVLKIWYQSAQAWYSFFADALTRTMVPEILLNDENMVYVDSSTQDNYVRYSYADGSCFYQWMSANCNVVNYSTDNQAMQGLIADAPTLQPVVLNKGEFKQFFATVHVPENAASGIYHGKINMIADGKQVASADIAVRVLPFALPQARTNYNLNKPFYLCMYGTAIRNPNVLKNLVAHNSMVTKGFPFINTFSPEQFEEDLKLAKECGLDLSVLFCCAKDAAFTVGNPPTGNQARQLQDFRRIIERTGEMSKKYFGHTNFYSYGHDEGDPNTIRGERAAWAAAHEAGGKVMVSTSAWRKLLFSLDYMILPAMPVEHRIKEVNLFHEANPNSLCGWYGDPHTGPENPDYNRRTHGMSAYKGNYDVSSNYCWWRNNWNDMATPWEEYLRNLVMVLLGRDGVFDTLEWEGCREGLDDIRYATKLKMLCEEGFKHPDGKVQLLARRAQSFLAYWDAERDDLNAFRLETINWILQLENAMHKGE